MLVLQGVVVQEETPNVLLLGPTPQPEIPSSASIILFRYVLVHTFITQTDLKQHRGLFYDYSFVIL
jgi:hypothetical protein